MLPPHHEPGRPSPPTSRSPVDSLYLCLPLCILNAVIRDTRISCAKAQGQILTQGTSCSSFLPQMLHIARHWTEAFAIPKNEDEVVMRIMEMGFSKDAAQRALKVGAQCCCSEHCRTPSCCCTGVPGARGDPLPSPEPRQPHKSAYVAQRPLP